MADLFIMLGFFVAAFSIGFALISRVPSLLHTPLMSMTNAISAVTILGALFIFSENTNGMETVLGGAAITLAMFNVVGGFVITHRMVGFFKKSGSSR